MEDDARPSVRHQSFLNPNASEVLPCQGESVAATGPRMRGGPGTNKATLLLEHCHYGRRMVLSCVARERDSGDQPKPPGALVARAAIQIVKCLDYLWRMTRGPAYFESKGACIYCGATDVKLSDEHIVPYSLGGTHVLRGASCLHCANITKKFEQKVARDLWGDARTAFNAPTRRRQERRSHITISHPDDSAKRLTVPAGEYPAGLVFYKMSQAGLLQGMPETVDISSSWQMVVIDDDKRREKFLERHPGRLVIRFRHVPDAFGRLLAKIGYCQVLTTLDPGDFRPICLPYITGDKTNVSYVVGGTFADQVPEPENGYSLTTAAFGGPHRLMLIALIRLYANTHSPAYHVVVGDAAGGENVESIMRKLGTTIDQASISQQSASGPPDHWLPQRLPLPFWIGDPAL